MFATSRRGGTTTKARFSALRPLFVEGKTFRGQFGFGALHGAEWMSRALILEDQEWRSNRKHISVTRGGCIA